jgi:DNA-binding NtrC family response regulator
MNDLRGCRVLVADDQLLIAQLIGQVLASLGCEVIGPARTVAETLAAIRTPEIDGVLLDLYFGRERCDPVARELARRSIPFVVMSGTGVPTEASALLAEAPLLTKPFTTRQLEDIVSRTFSRREAGQLRRP